MDWDHDITALPKPTHLPMIESIIPFNYGNQDVGFAISQWKEPNKPPRLLSFLISHTNHPRWKWIDSRTPFIPAGPPGSFYENGAVALQNEPMIIDREMLIYINGFGVKDGGPYGTRSIGVAKLRRDGFVRLEVPKESSHGFLVTKSITVPKAQLYVNFEPGKDQQGFLKVALLDTNGKVIPGFGLEDSIPVGEDSTHHIIAWRKGSDLSSLLGKEIKVRFDLVNLVGAAKLYAFGFEDR